MERNREMTEQADDYDERMKIPYVLAKRRDWRGFMKFFRKRQCLLDKHIDLHKSTPFHYAAHSGDSTMYKEMLGKVNGPLHIQYVLRMQDDKGNTPLHEVAFAGDLGMTKAILKYEDEETGSLLDMRNHLGETPVYRAAALGKTDLLKYFVEDRRIDLRKHFHRTGDKMSILHTAVIDQFFGTALWLLKRYEELADREEDNGLTTLQLLATMPSAFKSQTEMGTFKRLLYPLLPNYQDYKYYLQNNDETRKGGDLEGGMKGKNQSPETQRKLSAFSWMWYTMRKYLAKEWKGIEKLERKKEMNKLAEELVYLLAKKDVPRRQTTLTARDRTISTERSFSEQGAQEESRDQEDASANKPTTYTPLLMAACNGIMEIVKVIIHLHPQLIEHVNEDEQNILFMAVKHRQLEIYRLLKKLKMVRHLAGKIDKLENTILHYTADFQGGRQPGYALQLQEELRWFERIEKRLPYHYTIHRNKKNKTAKQIFIEKHEGLLRDARQWMKETAQSCSAVAVLVATVVFAAAYTVPGGTDESGLPRFLHHPIFLVFTVMDVVSLATSLASVVMFLSILTSPCEMWDFRRSLPRKLVAGFSLLFFSLATTMVSFSTTILVTIKFEKNTWTSSLTYCAAFFPVSVFAMVQFPLYLTMKECAQNTLKRLRKISPRFFHKLITKKTIWEFSN